MRHPGRGHIADQYVDFYQWIRSDGLVVAAGSFHNVTIVPNNELRITLNATSVISVILSMSVNSGVPEEINLTIPGADLCLVSPGWFVFAPSETSIANFGDVAYDGAVAKFKNGTSAGPLGSDAVIANIQRGNKTYTETDVGGLSVTVRYRTQ